LRNPEAPKKKESTRRQAASPDWRLRIFFYSCSVFAGTDQSDSGGTSNTPIGADAQVSGNRI